MIKFSNVSKGYDSKEVLHSLNLEIKEGEFFILVGPSGCGKTTTLKMINRLVGLSDGTIYIHNKSIEDYDIHELRYNIGYVLQQIALFPHMTVSENIAIVPELKKWSREKIKGRVDELLTMVGLDPKQYRNRKPDELSGGEQQRVGVIRALAADPDILLMDEPFSALDPLSREKLQDDIIRLQQKIRKTIIFVTHDMAEALKLGTRICIMKGGEIEQIGTPEEIVHHPKSDFVKKFVGLQKTSLEKEIKAEQLLSSALLENDVLQSLSKISATASLKEVLASLKIEEEVAVEKEGFVIGKIDRKTVIQYLAETEDEKDDKHESVY
ncbi:ABC transporter ATP-binding protein [Bacillus sp. JZ8]